MHQQTRLSRTMQIAVTTVKEYIDRHPLDHKGIEDYKEIAAINRKLLQKAFKIEIGKTISEYQLDKRMEAAAGMLREGRLSNKQIAYKCGYQNANNFSRAFKKVFKCTPSECKNGDEQTWTDGIEKGTDGI